MKKVIFLFMFLASALVTALALPTVDYGAFTTNANSALVIATQYRALLEMLGIWLPVSTGLTFVIALMTAIHKFFPKIDGK